MDIIKFAADRLGQLLCALFANKPFVLPSTVTKYIKVGIDDQKRDNSTFHNDTWSELHNRSGGAIAPLAHNSSQQFVDYALRTNGTVPHSHTLPLPRALWHLLFRPVGASHLVQLPMR